MKKILLILSLFIYSFANADCNSAIQTAKNYVDTYIVPNGQNAITGQRANAALNYIITALKCVDTISDLSFTKNSTRDSFVIVYKGVRFAVKDSIGIGGGGGSQTLSISNDTLTISNGNSVILPIYFQSDSATITSYDVLNSQNAPPISPNTGDTYLVGTSPSGAWVGHAKDIAEWNGSSWDFTDGVQGDFLYNATTALTYIFRSGNWVQTTGIPALNNGNTISSGLKIGTNNLKSLTFETNNKSVSRFDSIGRFYVYDTALRKSNKFLQIDSSTGRLIASDILNSSSSSSLFPNGIEFVNASRDFNSGDANKILAIKSDDITLSMPSVNPFGKGDLVGIQNTNDYKNTHIILKEGNEPILIGDEVFIFDLVDIGGGIYVPQPLTGIIYDENGENEKSIIKYLYDKSQNTIPLSGTEVGKPVTGDIEVSPALIGNIYNNDGSQTTSISFEAGSTTIRSKQNDNSLNGSFNVTTYSSTFSSDDATSPGFQGAQDYSANITDLDYTQKIYVDNIAGKIIDLGTITYVDINNSPATANITFNLGQLPAGYYIDNIYSDVQEAFDATFNSDENGINTSNQTFSYLKLTNVRKDVHLKEFNRYEIADTDLDIIMNIVFNIGGGEINPQNLTTGSITVKALIKKFPN